MMLTLKDVKLLELQLFANFLLATSTRNVHQHQCRPRPQDRKGLPEIGPLYRKLYSAIAVLIWLPER